MKNILAFLMAIFVMLSGSDVWANSLNYYQNLLLTKKFYLAYEEVTPQPRQTNRDRVSLNGTNFMKTGAADFLVNQQTDVIVVENGNNRYEEVSSEHGAMCRLQTGQKVYNFTKRMSGGKVTYYGKKKGEVEEQPYNRLAEVEYGRSYGTENMSVVLNALFPSHLRAAKSLRFYEVGSGKNKKGLSYIDYRADYGNDMYVIRYYFEGSKMVKIFSAKYYTSPEGKFDGIRHIFKIKAFTHELKPNYLRLPADLKIVVPKRG